MLEMISIFSIHFFAFILQNKLAVSFYLFLNAFLQFRFIYHKWELLCKAEFKTNLKKAGYYNHTCTSIVFQIIDTFTLHFELTSYIVKTKCVFIRTKKFFEI